MFDASDLSTVSKIKLRINAVTQNGLQLSNTWQRLLWRHIIKNPTPSNDTYLTEEQLRQTAFGDDVKQRRKASHNKNQKQERVTMGIQKRIYIVP